MPNYKYILTSLVVIVTRGGGGGELSYERGGDSRLLA